jgi:LCP family protein required for cell wall assembly
MGSALPPDGLDAAPDEPEPAEPPELDASPAAASRTATAPRRRWYRRHKRLLIWSSASLALLLVAVTATGFLALRHFNTNLEQDDISGLLGSQPVDTHPQAENIMVLGSDSRQGLSKAYGSGLVTDQSDTLMIIHIPASRQWAEVMSIPRDSYVNIPACEMGNGQESAPTQGKINEAFAIGNLDGNNTKLGVACTVKTVEQDTGIYVNHFIVVNFTGFEKMVAALGGVYECNPTAINDPNSGLHLTAGTHLLTPVEALGYVRARYTIGDGSDLERIDRQQAFMSSLISRVESKLLDPLAIYRFLDAATGSLTIDSQLGGITGLYNLAESLRGIPSDKIAFFTIPNIPRSEVIPSDTANVLWTQPEDSKIFASFRDDVPASSTLFGSSTGASVPLTEDSPQLVTPSATAAATSSAATSSATASSAAATGSASASTPAASASGTASPAISARTANQSICAG